MPSALRAFGLQSGAPIVFASSGIGATVSPGVVGAYEPDVALAKVLGSAPLTFVASAGGFTVVNRLAKQVRPQLQLVALPAAPPRDRIRAILDGAPLTVLVDEVVVSASRLANGYQQPTPVLMLGPDLIDREAKPDIGDAIRQIPFVGGGAPQTGFGAGVISGAPAGQSTLVLRGLGVQRTLVLFDGQRVVNSNITGGVDLNTIPSTLVRRVDVVTGGASAAWGSDAVAGVVNLIINRKFKGLKAHVETSDNDASQYATTKAELSWGRGFKDDRAHIILSGSYTEAPDAVYLSQTAWHQGGSYLVPNPRYVAGAGQPKLIHVNNAGLSQATPGGLIVSNPAGATPGSANILRGIQFTGPQATVSAYDFGTIAGVLSYGGSGNFYTNENPFNLIAVPYRSETLFGSARYDLTDKVQATLQLNYGRSFAQNSAQSAANFGNLTIYADNPYIPASVRATMAQNGIGSFVMGTLNTNNVDLRNLSPAATSKSLGIPVNDNHRSLMRGVFTLEGALGDNWTWNAYAQRATVKVGMRVINNTLNPNLRAAQDAVTVTEANRGASGLALGSIVCRSTLSNPANGCKPVNPFGEGVASSEAIAYINSYGDIDREDIRLNQDVIAASMNGQLPWSLPAGPVPIAFGIEHRKESGSIVADPRANAAQWYSANFSDFSGEYHVEEGFLELDVPILKDRLVKTLNLNAAGRLTDYSTSGLVKTWKLGATSQVNDDLRLRATLSTDIRAPNLSELFASHQINTGIQTDPRTGLPVTVFIDRGGNPDLTPEIARTVTAGVVVSPRRIEGLSLSIDWYSILVKGAIATPSATNVILQCQAGVDVYCAQLDFDGPDGALSMVHTTPINSSYQKVEGVDVQLDYRMPMFGGAMAWRAVGNFNNKNVSTTLGVPCEGAGQVGSNANCAGSPKFTGVASATYSNGPWSLSGQARYTRSYKLNNDWVSGVDVDDNTVPAKTYIDLRGSYRWNDNVQTYAAVDNVFDTDPLVIPAYYAAGSPYTATFGQGDLLGRVIRLGVRLAY